jgi:hypothetical protein
MVFFAGQVKFIIIYTFVLTMVFIKYNQLNIYMHSTSYHSTTGNHIYRFDALQMDLGINP